MRQCVQGVDDSDSLDVDWDESGRKPTGTGCKRRTFVERCGILVREERTSKSRSAVIDSERLRLGSRGACWSATDGGPAAMGDSGSLRLRRIAAHLRPVGPFGTDAHLGMQETAAKKKADKPTKKKNSPLVLLSEVPEGTELVEPPVAALPEGKWGEDSVCWSASSEPGLTFSIGMNVIDCRCDIPALSANA